MSRKVQVYTELVKDEVWFEADTLDGGSVRSFQIPLSTIWSEGRSTGVLQLASEILSVPADRLGIMSSRCHGGGRTIYTVVENQS